MDIVLTRPSSILRALLARDRFGDIGVPFEPHQTIAVIPSSEAVTLFPFVLEHSFLQIASNSDREYGCDWP